MAVSLLAPVEAALAHALQYLDNSRQSDAIASLKQAQDALRRQLPPNVSPLEPFEIYNER